MTERLDSLEFRRAATGDVDALVGLLVGGTLTPGAEDPSDYEGYCLALEELASTENGEVVVAVVGDEVVAMAELLYLRHFQHRGGLCAEVESVHVRTDLRSHGIGSQLMAEVLRRAKERDAYRVQLTSNATRTQAHQFYERLGFQPTHVGYKFSW